MADHSAMTARVAEGGRIVIPAALRKALEIEPGDEVLLKLEDDSLRIVSRKSALKSLRSMVSKAVPAGSSFVHEFIEERRKQARAEES